MQITPSQLKKLKKEMKNWANQSPEPSITISEEGLTKALLDADKLTDQHEFDKKVIAWFHLMKLVTGIGNNNKHKRRFSRTKLFEVMSLTAYQKMIDDIPSDWDTDEVPTDWMRDLYRQYLDWMENGGYQKSLWHPSDAQIRVERTQARQNVK